MKIYGNSAHADGGQLCLQSQFHQISPFSGQNRVNWGCVGGIPKYLFVWIPNIFVTQEPIQNSQTVAQTLMGETAHFSFCSPQIGFFKGVGGGHPKIFFIGIFIFLLLRSPCKILKLQHKPFWEKQPILAVVPPKSAFLEGQAIHPRPEYFFHF